MSNIKNFLERLRTTLGDEFEQEDVEDVLHEMEGYLTQMPDIDYSQQVVFPS